MEPKATQTNLERVGAYRIKSYLGQGGMGEVFLAFDERLKRPVALKRLHPEISTDKVRQRLLHEARALARLRHPSVVQIYDLVDDGEDQFLVMEYVDGRSISELLREAGPLPLPLALSLAREVASGLAAAHRQGIIHRDLKAENVMVTDTGEARILDFGLAKMKEDAARILTGRSNIVGTYRAMSPEQALGRPVDARSDLFSFGVLLYEMFTGTSPFLGDHPMETLRRLTAMDPTPAGNLRPDLPAKLARLMDQLLQKDPAFRPPDAEAVVRGLEGLSKATELAKVLAALLVDGDQQPKVAAIENLPTQEDSLPETSASATEPPTRPALLPTPPQTSKWTALQRVALVAVLGALALLLALRARSVKEDLRVLVLDPEVGKEASAEVKNVAPAVFMAALEGLTELDGVVVLEPSALPPETKMLGDSAAHTAARAIAAHEILRIRLEEARDHTALVSMQRMGSSTEVEWRKSFIVPTSTEDLAFLTDEVAAHLRSAFPQRAPSHRTTTLGDRERSTLLMTKLRIRRGETLLQPELEILEALVAQDPDDLETRLLTAEVAWLLYADTKKSQLLETANHHLQAAHRVAPNDPRPWINTVHMHLALNQPDEAATALTEVQRVRPGDPATLALSARVLKAQGQVSAALVNLRAAVTRRHSWLLLYELADLEYQSGRLEEGRAHFAQLAELVPGNRWVLQKTGNLELLFGDLERAEDIYRQLTITTPHRAAYTNLGLAAFLRGRLNEAAESYERALELAPDHVVVLLNLADTELARGQVPKAHALYQRTLQRLDELDANTLGPLYAMNRAQCLAHLGDSLGAVEITRKVLRQQPSHPEVLYMAAVVYAILGEGTSTLLHISDALDEGIQPRWFRIPIFDSVREDPNFQQLLSKNLASRPD